MVRRWNFLVEIFRPLLIENIEEDSTWLSLRLGSNYLFLNLSSYNESKTQYFFFLSTIYLYEELHVSLRNIFLTQMEIYFLNIM